MTSIPSTKIPFTQEAFVQLKKDLDRLLEEEKAVIFRLQTAREMGDLSENGAYHAAKFELGSVRRQLGQVRYFLSQGHVVNKTAGDVIGFGSLVTVSTNNKQLTFTLVSQHESNPSDHKFSVESPLGQALMGKKAGQKTIALTPQGEVEYHILKVE
jgi:transcription elongation factor GreA